MTTTRFARLLIDAADTLADASDADDAWMRVEAVAARIGASAVNAGAFLRGAPGIAWMRSTMAPDWLDEYAGAEYHDSDPVLQAAIAGTPPPLYDVAARARDTDGTPGAALHAGMLRHGYRYMLTHSWIEGTTGKTLALATEGDPTDLFGHGTARALSAVSAMLSLSLGPPGSGADAARFFGANWQRLSVRETDILSLLAHGLNEGDIADRLRLTEREVWREIRDAARKMDAHSRDQTLALAMSRGLLRL
ncbi:helix-turn-helix transcriptional regulator [Roseivivax sediminis]|uniref:Autoinducer binding domain-containing protein n=1 Tax=Roseivivax sediminis TaxID=936889 RepID=A0A1I2ASC1_9RHOB|nr:helix-turn-helix transcriptional regulator [Roseivivax sediminis]SFE46884.1 Autoinducer binding domain-containing protein [Roseivivax sediminis]